MTTTTPNLWAGQLVRLRAVEPRDWEAFHANDLDTESQRNGWSIQFPRSEAASKEWAEREAKAEPLGDNVRFAIENLQGELVGTLNTHSCNPRAGTFSYGLVIFRPHWRKGYAREAIQIVLRYYFGELRYQKVNAQVYSFNEASARLHESLGFRLEGRLRRMGFTDGQPYDELHYGLTREEFEQPLLTQQRRRTWLDWARQIQAVAQIGLTYAEIAYDRERYENLQTLAVEIFSAYTGEESQAVLKAVTTQPGYTTPKVDVRAACFRADDGAGKILLVRERSDGRWCLPGGWADVGDVPSEAAAREVHEEAGFLCTAQKLLGVFDANRAGEPLSAYHAYKLVFLCDITGGDAQANHETQEVCFFGRDEIPPLSEARSDQRVLAECFAHWDDAQRPAHFD
jgi:RimJ/RimL family protein N-acetyltransferase/ADP-ribose pyrophosphatase YjhB (NUDIX family)